MSRDRNKWKKETEESMDRLCAAMDCTGLIPSGTPDEAERQAYEAICPYLPDPPEKGRRKEKQPEVPPGGE